MSIQRWPSNNDPWAKSTLTCPQLVAASRHLGRLKMEPMTAEQAATLKRLAETAYEREAFKPNLTRAKADVRIATLTAKLKLLGEPPHTL
jgi:hypothetical protein